MQSTLEILRSRVRKMAFQTNQRRASTHAKGGLTSNCDFRPKRAQIGLTFSLCLRGGGCRAVNRTGRPSQLTSAAIDGGCTADSILSTILVPLTGDPAGKHLRRRITPTEPTRDQRPRFLHAMSAEGTAPPAHPWRQRKGSAKIGWIPCGAGGSHSERSWCPTTISVALFSVGVDTCPRLTDSPPNDWCAAGADCRGRLASRSKEPFLHVGFRRGNGGLKNCIAAAPSRFGSSRNGAWTSVLWSKRRRPSFRRQ